MEHLLTQWTIALFLVINPYASVHASVVTSWEDFVDPGILQQYSGKDLQDRFSDDVFEGDIMEPFVPENQADGVRLRRDVFTDRTLLWPNGRVPYNFSRELSKSQKTFVKKVLKSITKVTSGCIEFAQRKTEIDYINIVQGFGCFSSVGRQGGQQVLSLKEGCLENTGDVVHLLFHALGFYHENARNDRDKHVKINFDNVRPEKVNHIEKYIDPMPANLPYDIQSILHLPFNIFAVNNRLPTIIPTEFKAVIGQNERMSSLDLARIKKAYSCEQKDSDEAATLEEGLAVELDPPDNQATTSPPVTNNKKLTGDTVRKQSFRRLPQRPFMFSQPWFAMSQNRGWGK